MGHMDRPTQVGHVRGFLERARAMGLREIGFSDHDYYEPYFDFDVIRQTALEYQDMHVRVGVEFDYVPGQEQRIADIINRYELDYAIGSVHEVYGWAFDILNQKDVPPHLSQDELYQQYFDLVRQGAQSGLFQIIGHLDLIKLNGIRPKGDVRELAADALQAIVAGDLCVEINTNGLNKSVREVYPENRLIAELAAEGCAFTLGSDAHEAVRTGENLDMAADILRACGVKHVYSFSQKKRISYSLV